VVDGKRCPTVVRALGGGYRYGKTRDGVRKPNPEKNNYSHCADALQYARLAVHGGMTNLIMSRLSPPKGTTRRVPKGGWT
jgi:hypothetical protein